MVRSRSFIVVCGLALCLLAGTAGAQHHGNRSADPGNSSGPPVNEDIKQFDLAVALQASPEQAKQSNDWASDTDAARKQAEVLTEAAITQTGLHTLALSDVLDDLQTDHDRFFGGFSATQKSGLKEFVKKAARASADISRENKNLKAAGSDPQRVAVLAGKIDKALSELQADQLELEGQMGIQRDSSSLH